MIIGRGVYEDGYDNGDEKVYALCVSFSKWSPSVCKYCTLANLMPVSTGGVERTNVLTPHFCPVWPLLLISFLWCEIFLSF